MDSRNMLNQEFMNNGCSLLWSRKEPSDQGWSLPSSRRARSIEEPWHLYPSDKNLVAHSETRTCSSHLDTLSFRSHSRFVVVINWLLNPLCPFICATRN